MELINDYSKESIEEVEEKQIKRRKPRRKVISIDEIRMRKRHNRDSANHNDYGNEGFLLMIFYYLGCTLTLRKIKKEGKNQKLKIESIKYEDIEILSREVIEKDIEDSKLLNNSNEKTRTKRIMVNIIIDNTMLDILKNQFGFVFDQTVKKKPEKEFMPQRWILAHIKLEKDWTMKEIIEEGSKFYNNIKLFGKDKEVIQLSKDIVSKHIEKILQKTKSIDNTNESESYYLSV
ncbi:hypothetical protein EDI_275810 [Entamoeba dispar SAW760]|uniref:Uncharacterized protein n=1 Tax=Entamoeba dispar (strain ATCC PRA-260 / SAW760) TaxID=370354 RepID=B0E7L3_ENTDS|nr:uncharacterized protein EDI_275810 [Entamoeba dispar SAW760]EDR29483.1 hypothetical protein EDI_275810 [Entamoeba dispar SAW760]|eukprot:EDR29483.1 hypothetical protein EDI_275810 [Entamoeba dispar SAW760]